MPRAKGITTSDVIRSMKRLGFSDEEVYDVLAGLGLPGEQVQLLIERISREFEEAGLKPRTSRLGLEVKEVFQAQLEKFGIEAFGKLGEVLQGLQLVRAELQWIRSKLEDLQALVHVGRRKN